MFPIFLSLFLGSVLVSGGDPQNPAQEAESSQEASASEPSGIATVVEVSGKAKAISRTTGQERFLKQGDALYLDETISTADGASLQMEIADESLFTLSENTDIRMDLFDLDETQRDGHLTATVAKGVFRFVSGKVAKLKPENVNIEVPSGTIGIRGTIVLGEIDGEKCLVSLEAEEGDELKHRIVFSSMVDGQKQEVEITKPGFATMIEARGMAPKPVFELPQENRERFQQSLPQPKYLPRDQHGRPVMSPDVRDPQKFPGPMKRERDEQNYPGGPNPPQGPDGSELGKFQEPNGRKSPLAFREGGDLNGGPEPKDSGNPFFEKQGETQENLSKLSPRSFGDPKTENFKGDEKFSQDSRPQNGFHSSNKFGSFKPDFGSFGPQGQSPPGGSFSKSSNFGLNSDAQNNPQSGPNFFGNKPGHFQGFKNGPQNFGQGPGSQNQPPSNSAQPPPPPEQK